MLISTLSFAAATHAQTSVKFPTIVGDTVVNTGTQSKVIAVTGGYSGVAVQVILTKLSGTGAGTVKVQGSLDGTNYKDIGSAYTITDVTTQSCTFYVTAPLPQYVKVLTTGSGTESILPVVYYRLSKYQTY